MKALLDGDICAYRTAAASEETELEYCLLRLDRMVREILHVTQADTYEIFLSGEGNFRYDIFPEYKANRKDTVRPKWLQPCREYLVTEWKAKLAHGCEADDLMAIEQRGTKETVICTIDKDLLQVPGLHYNFVKNEWYEIYPFGGLKKFYTQLIMGDRSDGIPGIAGLGPVKAGKMLEGCETEQEMFDVCREAYDNDALMIMYGQCLWIQREEGKIWDPTSLLTGQSQSSSEAEEPSGSTTPREEEIIQSLDLITPDKDGYLAHGV
jgi:5'-3' exonuclease